MTLAVNPEDAFRNLFDWLTPAGFERLVAGETPDSLNVEVKMRVISSEVNTSEGLLGSHFAQWSSALDENLPFDWGIPFEWDYAKREKGLPYLTPDGSLVKMWHSDETEGILQRFFSEVTTPLPLVEAVLTDSAESPERFSRYCAARGYPMPEALNIDWEPAMDGLRYLVRDGPAESVPEQKPLREAFDEFIYATCDAYFGGKVRHGHLIVIPPVSDVLCGDAEAVTRKITAGATSREAVVAALLPDTPGIAEAVDGRGGANLAGLLDDILRLREARLQIPEGVDDEPRELIRRLQKRPPWEGIPAKPARWLLFTAAGVIADAAGAGGAGAAAGIGLSAFDAFLLERLLERWRPDQYVPQYRRALDRLARQAAR
ncbi:MAG: hypothetical protein ACHQHO_02665 [Solirubrobacterales bacterium]